MKFSTKLLIFVVILGLISSLSGKIVSAVSPAIKTNNATVAMITDEK